MAFLEVEDYSVLIRKELKNIVEESEFDGIEADVKRLQAEGMAISQIKNSLSGRYDTDAVFSAEGNARNHYIVMISVDLTLYHLYTSVAPNLIPDVRSTRYQDAIDWLKDVRKGDANADLPRWKDEAGEDQFDFRFGSERKNENNKW